MGTVHQMSVVGSTYRSASLHRDRGRRRNRYRNRSGQEGAGFPAEAQRRGEDWGWAHVTAPVRAFRARIIGDGRTRGSTPGFHRLLRGGKGRRQGAMGPTKGQRGPSGVKGGRA
jgi:hypothetical protein